jgi:hypothetical protein
VAVVRILPIRTKEKAMARKEAPRIDPVSLYEEKVVYIIEILENSAFGRFWTDKGIRVQSAVHATQFDDYEEAHAAILRNCLENVSIVKAWV